jgi:hypothetical protein
MLLTGLTGASHLWDLPRVNCLTRVFLGLGVAGQFLVCLVFWGFLAVTGLTGVLHQPDRCGAFLWKSPSLTSRDRSDRWCSPV